MPAILTIGHSNHSPDDFIGLLRGNEVELLVDVRRHPGSRHVPWTNTGHLQEVLASAGIGYLHLESLGGRRKPNPDSPNGGWRVKQFQGYADHMGSAEFARGLDELEAAASRRRAALMCAEAQWWRCHRRLVADALKVRGWTVLHIMGSGEPGEHELTEFALVEEGVLAYPSRQGQLG